VSRAVSPGFGDVLRSRRRRLALTQEDLAGRAGVSVRSIRDIETGRISRPRPTTVRLLATGLGLTPRDCDAFYISALVPSARPPREVPGTTVDVPGTALGEFCGLVESALLAAGLAPAAAAVVRDRLVDALAGELPVSRRSAAC
jgi:transcriptional regulator with XRE-family HTH domain